MQLTKRYVKQALNLKTDAALARVFSIGRAATNAWRDDQSIPTPRQWELAAKRPDLFVIQEGKVIGNDIATEDKHAA